MKISKFLFLNPNVLCEYIYDNDNLKIHDYVVVQDTRDGKRSLYNSDQNNSQSSEFENTLSNSLFEIDPTQNTWGLNSPVQNSFLQISNYTSTTPIRYDRLKVYFPINYNFEDYLGFVLRLSTLATGSTNELGITSYYYDKTQIGRSLELAAPPLNYNQRLWGKFLELEFPSPYALSQQVDSTGISSQPVPVQGTINKNLAGQNNPGVASNSPLFIDFEFLATKLDQGKDVWKSVNPYETTIPIVPEFETLGVSIKHSQNGDYFEIEPTYNGTISDFAVWQNQQSLVGNQQYIIATVTTFERNIQTSQNQFVKTDNFQEPILFRPIFSVTTTTANIDVEIKIINAQTENFILRRTSLSLMPDQASKYGRKLTKINIENAFKPKIYNASPDQINMRMRRVQTRNQEVRVPFPVLIDRFNVVAKNKTEEQEGETFYGIGQLQILLYPSDNVIRLAIAKQIQNQQVQYLQLPQSPIFMTFKSQNKEVLAGLYNDSGEVDIENGIAVFRITEEQMREVRAISQQGFDSFYVESRPENGPKTVIYAGRFLLYDEF